MKIFIATILLIFAGIAVSHSQQMTYDNYYLINKYSLSPALCGLTGNTEALLGIRQNWVGITGAPEKQTVLLNGPTSEDSKAGFGMSFTHEKTGNFSHFMGGLAYSFQIPLTRESAVCVGLAAEVYRNQLEFADVKGQEDPVLLNQDVYKGTAFNAAFGAAYHIKDRDKQVVIGLVVPRILETKISYYKESKYTMVREFMVHASYFAEINRDLDIEPFVNVRMTMNSGLLYEANVRVRFLKQVWVAPGYRTGAALVSAGASLGSRIVMNYSYEYGLSGIAASSSGSHEISLCFLVKAPRRQIGPTIFSGADDAVVSKKKDEDIDNLKKELKTQQDSTNKKIAELAAQLEELKKEPNVTEKPKAEKDAFDKPLILSNITFPNNSDKMLTSSFPSLNRLSIQMKNNPSLIIKITGHTDNVGAARYNERLSKNRAQAVADYLIKSRGIEESRIIVEGKGQTEPIAPNDTDQGRSKNRRIEVRFKKK